MRARACVRACVHVCLDDADTYKMGSDESDRFGCKSCDLQGQLDPLKMNFPYLSASGSNLPSPSVCEGISVCALAGTGIICSGNGRPGGHCE